MKHYDQMKTLAVLLRGDTPVAKSETGARGGDVVEVCFGSAIDSATDKPVPVSSGRAKVTRARRWLSPELLEDLPLAIVCRPGTSQVL